MKSFVDVSHAIENGLVTYPGLPSPVICDFLSREDSRKHYEEGTEFQIGRIDMVAKYRHIRGQSVPSVCERQGSF